MYNVWPSQYSMQDLRDMPDVDLAYCFIAGFSPKTVVADWFKNSKKCKVRHVCRHSYCTHEGKGKPDLQMQFHSGPDHG